MNIKIKNIGEKDCVCRALVLPVLEGETGFYKELSPSLSQILAGLSSKEFSGKKNELFLIPGVSGIKPERVLLVGLGKIEEISEETLRQVGGKSAVYLNGLGLENMALSTAVIKPLKLSPAACVEGALLGLYTYTRYRKEKDGKGMTGITLLAAPSKELSAQIESAKTTADAVCFARDLVNTPANDMTPTDLAKASMSLKKQGVSVRVIEKKEAERLGMGAYLSVAKGSHQPPKFIVLEYGKSKTSPIVLIGKSITFDSGGISIKPSDGMEKMKYDMAGGAAVLGVFKAVAEAGMPVNLVGILPATENLPGGSASKPGDVVTSINGMTVEIINTDAEGRLIIADAIGYAKRFKPRAVIDTATLTGACMIAFGGEAIAMMGNDCVLLDRMKKAGEAVYERVWEMPLYDEYKDYIKSDIADIKNTGGKTGSLVTSGYFLKEFAGETPWVHLDIAGTAWVEKDKPYVPKGASGIGVRLLLKFIEGLSEVLK